MQFTDEEIQIMGNLINHDPVTTGPDPLLHKNVITILTTKQSGHWLLVDRRNHLPMYGHC